MIIFRANGNAKKKHWIIKKKEPKRVNAVKPKQKPTLKQLPTVTAAGLEQEKSVPKDSKH